jgi:hypothetical protein
VGVQEGGARHGTQIAQREGLALKQVGDPETGGVPARHHGRVQWQGCDASLTKASVVGEDGKTQEDGHS